jgi:hypothetical protein
LLLQHPRKIRSLLQQQLLLQLLLLLLLLSLPWL